MARTLRGRAGVVDHQLQSVEDAGAWMPAPGAYANAAARRGVDLHDLLLLAVHPVHPWGIDGAPAPGCGPRG